MRFSGKRGQTMLEYVITFSALLVLVGALTYLLTRTRHAVVRTENLVSSDYP